MQHSFLNRITISSNELQWAVSCSKSIRKYSNGIVRESQSSWQSADWYTEPDINLDFWLATGNCRLLGRLNLKSYSGTEKRRLVTVRIAIANSAFCKRPFVNGQNCGLLTVRIAIAMVDKPAVLSKRPFVAGQNCRCVDGQNCDC